MINKVAVKLQKAAIVLERNLLLINLINHFVYANISSIATNDRTN